MKNCETCGVPQEKRPGCLKGCVIVDFSETMKEPFLKWHFTDYKQKESEKTCGNCGWHGEHYKGNTWAVCNNSKLPCESIHDGHGFRTEDTRKAGELRSCQWKPTCETCQGTGKVCKTCGLSINECDVENQIPIPCPTCQKPKEERLMMPKKFLSWKNRKGNEKSFWLEDDEGFHYAHVYPGTTGDFAWFLDINKMVEKCHYSTLDKAQAAVEKALGVERG